jgi:parallel beta-helix repeat protein
MPVRSVRLILVGMSVFVATLLGVAGIANATTFTVHPGESIQAAVDAAQPGDTIVVEAGVYRENVEVRKDDLTIRGAGSGEDGTILEPPAEEADTVCTRNDAPGIGFCVVGPVGEEQDEPFEPGGPVVLNLHLNGFRIRNFDESGAFLFHSRYARISDVAAVDNGEYGIFSNDSQGTRIADSLATGSGEAGFYIGDSRNSANGVVDSVATGNHDGIFVRDASQGLIEGNTIRDNCIGISVLDTGAPVQPSRWMIRGNIVSHNNAACEPNEEAPPLSGAGIVLFGAHDTTVRDNRVNNNRASGPSAVRGGIVVVASPAGGGVPVGNLITGNTAHRNSPADLVYDGSGSNNRFRNNDCGRSIPRGLCR